MRKVMLLLILVIGATAETRHRENLPDDFACEAATSHCLS